MDSMTKVPFNWTFKQISYEEAINLTGYTHAAHCCIFAINPDLVMKRFPARASIMMQNRFDGLIGFPGGAINKENHIIDGLNRELVEEINLDKLMFHVRESDHVSSHVDGERKMCLHLFKMNVSLDEFKSIEKRVFDAVEYGQETMGTLRVPLYTMECGVRGFPSFLSNSFAGNARDQLLIFLLKEKLLSEEELMQAVSTWKKKYVQQASGL